MGSSFGAISNLVVKLFSNFTATVATVPGTTTATTSDTNTPHHYINEGMPLEVVSMDADALYPSITAKRAKEVVEEQVTKTRVEIQNVNYRMAAARYIAKGATPAQIFAWGLGHLCPRRTSTTGPRPGMSR